MMRNSGTSPYQTWQVGPAHVGEVVVQVATKPGVMAHGAVDAPAFMLAEVVAEMAVTGTAQRASLHLGSGNGLVPAVALAAGYAPSAFDRYAANAEATGRTLAATAASLSAQAPATRPPSAFHAAVASSYVEAASCSLATIRIPTDKLGVQMAIAEAFRALEVGGRVLLAGANDEGAKPAVRLIEQVFGHARLEAQHSGCRLVSATKLQASPADAAIFDIPWLDGGRFHELPVSTGGTRFSLFTRPGVFSWEHLDEATGILADLMRIEDGEDVLDLGCGAGALGIVAARQTPHGHVVLVDADADAVRCATRTAQAAQCRNIDVLASDVASAVGDRTFDVVVSNPPFHLGKGTELAIPRAFIEQAYACLRPGGRLYLVANRTLPYEQLIAECFGDVRTAHDGRRFKVIGGVRRG